MVSDPKRDLSPGDEYWQTFLTSGEVEFEKRRRWIFERLPENPRCKTCSAPFEGFGAPVVRILFGKRPSSTDPRFCNQCEEFHRKYPGGAEIEVTMVFADVRGSTTIAEKLSAAEFSRVINRFYQATTDVLLKSNAFIDRLIGDEVVGIYFQGLAGPMHARKAVEAAQDLLRVTGHADPAGPWISVGAGVHTGPSYVGVVGSETGAIDVTALGDVPNVPARLTSEATPGEVIVSEAAGSAAKLDMSEYEKRRLSLKGRSEPVEVSVIRIAPE